MVRETGTETISSFTFNQPDLNAGMSEVCGICTLQRQGDKIGSSGYVLKNTQLKVINPTDSGTNPLDANQVGELLWKSPYIMIGYYDNPQATSETLDKDG